MGHFETPYFNVLNFRGWIKFIFDKITSIYCVKNSFNPTSKVQNIENGVFQYALFTNAPFTNGRLPNRFYSCLWAKNKNSPLFQIKPLAIPRFEALALRLETDAIPELLKLVQF